MSTRHPFRCPGRAPTRGTTLWPSPLKGDAMSRSVRWLVVVMVMAAAVAVPIGPPVATAATPRWVLHVQRYSGGISNGVRQYAAGETPRASAPRSGGQSSPEAAAAGGLHNVQMND